MADTPTLAVENLRIEFVDGLSVFRADMFYR